MDSLRTSKSPNKNQPPLLTKWVRSTVGATLLAVELTLWAASTVATVGAGISPWSIWKKVESGMLAPERLIRHIKGLPREVADTEKLLATLDKPWSIEKVRELMDTGISLLRKIYDREKEHIKDIMGGIENYQKMPWETLVAMILVLIIYLLLVQSVRIIRLWDRDTWLDGMRKNIAYMLGSNRRIAYMSDREIEKELMKLVREKERRGL